MLQEVLLDADADMAAANLKPGLEQEGPSIPQKDTKTPQPPSQHKQPNLEATDQLTSQTVEAGPWSSFSNAKSGLQTRKQSGHQSDSAATLRAPGNEHSGLNRKGPVADQDCCTACDNSVDQSQSKSSKPNTAAVASTSADAYLEEICVHES